MEQQVQRTREWDLACDEIIEMREAIKQEFSQLGQAYIDLFIATLVIQNNLGEDWVTQHIDEQGRRSPAAEYLRSRPVNSLERHEHYVRVMELARRIFELGQEEFADRLRDNLRRRDLDGAAFEADVVRMLLFAPVVVDLRKEIGVKGEDYDIDLWLQSDQCWAIEVKTRADDAQFSSKALRRTLERARSQLPKNGVGAIFLRIPTPWLDDPAYQKDHANVVGELLSKTTRVQAVVLVWDAWTPRESGHGLYWQRRFRIFRGAALEEAVERLLDLYNEIWGASWNIGPSAPF